MSGTSAPHLYEVSGQCLQSLQSLVKSDRVVDFKLTASRNYYEKAKRIIRESNICF